MGLLLLAIGRAITSYRGLADGYYMFMRIVTLGALIGLILEKLPTWEKFVLLLLAILYNPLIPIHINDQEVWAWFNVLTIPALIAPWGVIQKKIGIGIVSIVLFWSVFLLGALIIGLSTGWFHNIGRPAFY